MDEVLEIGAHEQRTAQVVVPMDKEVPQGFFSALSDHKDIRITPLDSVYPGVEAQATVADNILTGDFIFRPDWALSPEVIKRVIRHPDMLKLGGQKRNLSILFTDIRSFTNISESMEPHELVNFMNEFLTAMTEVILKNRGTLDKYMGDAIMAFFGAPEDMPDHALVAPEDRP